MKIGNIIMFLGLFLILFLGLNYAISLYNHYNINKSEDYSIQVSQNVLDVLNKEYDQSQEKFFCIGGSVDDVNRIITINQIEKALLNQSTKRMAQTLERYACESKIGSIHTHPKFLSIFPICSASTQDIYTFAESSVVNNNRINGIYCSKDRVSFYLSNTYDNEFLFINNMKIR